MTPFATYELKVAAVLALFYMFYRLLLCRETLHSLNRAVLLCTAALAAILPLCVITVKKEAAGVAGTASEALGSELVAAKAASVPWADVIIFTGMAVVLAMTLISTVRTMLLIRSGEVADESNGIRTVVLDREIAPFSWMRTIVLSRIDWESGYWAIRLHERAHVELRHSWDVLMVDLLASFQWFNPVVWMLRNDLREIHEFQADDRVLRSGVDAKEYQLLLVKKSIAKSCYSIVNGFNHSLLEKRIRMMLTPKTKARAVLRVFYLIPVVCICLAANARTVYVTDVEDGIVSLDEAEVKPTFQGGNLNWLSLWLNERVNYPKEAMEAGIQGRVTVSFVVSKEGKINDIQILKGVHQTLDAEVVRVVGTAPPLSPGMIEGRFVDVRCAIPITFKLH